MSPVPQGVDGSESSTRNVFYDRELLVIYAWATMAALSCLTLMFELLISSITLAATKSTGADAPEAFDRLVTL